MSAAPIRRVSTAKNRRRKRSDYGEQLREKQKVKRIYGIASDSSAATTYKALKMTGVTGHTLIQCSSVASTTSSTAWASRAITPRRASSSATATSRSTARRSTSRRTSCARATSSQVKRGLAEDRRINEALAAVDRRGVPQWITLDKENFRGAINQLPSREDVTLPIREQLIIELYSK
jgi:small subunit ribosomal protein S4